MTFKPGDVVRATCGGPKMTVEKVGLMVETVWFTPDWRGVGRGILPPEALRPVRGWREALRALRRGDL